MALLGAKIFKHLPVHGKYICFPCAVHGASPVAWLEVATPMKRHVTEGYTIDRQSLVQTMDAIFCYSVGSFYKVLLE